MQNIKLLRKTHYNKKQYNQFREVDDWKGPKYCIEADYLLNEWIPAANFIQLYRFIDRKYERVIRNCPQIEAALKKILVDKINSLPQQFQKIQRQKILAYFRKHLANYECDENPLQNIYKFKQSADDQMSQKYVFQTLGLKIQIQNGSKLFVHKFLKSKQCGQYVEIFQKQENQLINPMYFAMTSQINKQNKQFKKPNGNFNRQVSKHFLIYENYITDMEYVESEN